MSFSREAFLPVIRADSRGLLQRRPLPPNQ
jgi:hypothetical protein